jgi:hypothetical protein
MRIKILAFVIGIALSITFVTPAFAAYNAGYSNLKPAKLIVDPFAECTNAFQCNATFLVGDTVTFTGLFTGDEGRFIQDANINIYRITATGKQLIASAVTERDGTFKTTWQAQFIERKEAGETFKQQMREVSTIQAEFEGDSIYASTKSGKIVITVRIMDVITYVATDKKLYREGETALIFVNFIAGEIEGKNIRYGDFITPDTIKATYDLEPVQLSEKQIGSYTFVTPPLTIGHHQLLINPAKDGYNSSVGFITVQVSGFFGK